MPTAAWRRSGALAALAAAASLSPARADEGQARVETTVLVRINQADHEGVDGSSLRVAPRSAHVAWRAQGKGTAGWTVDGTQGKPYSAVGPLVFSEDGEHFAYVAQTLESSLLVVDGQERAVPGVDPTQETLRFLPGGAGTAFLGLRLIAGEELSAASTLLWVNGAVGPPFARIDPRTLVFSTDGKRSAYVADVAESQQAVVVDGKAGKPYAARTIGAPRFSADGTRYGYEVSGLEKRLVVDGVEGPTFTMVWPLSFAPRGARYFYVAARGGIRVVLVDGREEPGLLDVMAPGPVWSADGQHLGYVAIKMVEHKEARRVVVDGVEGPVFGRIGAVSLRFSPDGKRHAYWASKGPKPFYVVDGVAQKEADQVGLSATFSADSKRFAYSVQRGEKWFVVTDGVEGPATDGLGVGFPAFTSDSAHVVYQAVVGGSWHLFIDGEPGPAFDGFAEDGFALGQGTSSVAVIARRGQSWRIVVDGIESGEEFIAVLPGSKLVADGPRSFRAWVARGGELLHLRATLIPGAAPR